MDLKQPGFSSPNDTRAMPALWLLPPVAGWFLPRPAVPWRTERPYRQGPRGRCDLWIVPVRMPIVSPILNRGTGVGSGVVCVVAPPAGALTLGKSSVSRMI